MERRLAITYSITATVTLGIACFAFAAVGGGLFADAVPELTGEGKSVEFIDDYIVLHSSSTLAPDLTAFVGVDSVPAPAPAGDTPRAAAQADGSTAAPGPVALAPAAPDAPAAATLDAPSNQGPAPTPAQAAAPAPPPAPLPVPAPAPAPPMTTTVAPKPAPAPAPAPTTTAPRATTTTAPTTSLPSGVRIPSDWPSGTPIPPIPPGCREPQLEDNGVWNCQ